MTRDENFRPRPRKKTKETKKKEVPDQRSEENQKEKKFPIKDRKKTKKEIPDQRSEEKKEREKKTPDQD